MANASAAELDAWYAAALDPVRAAMEVEVELQTRSPAVVHSARLHASQKVVEPSEHMPSEHVDMSEPLETDNHLDGHVRDELAAHEVRDDLLQGAQLAESRARGEARQIRRRAQRVLRLQVQLVQRRHHRVLDGCAQTTHID